MEEIEIYNGRLSHPKKYDLIGIYVSKDYFEKCNVTKEQLRTICFKYWYDSYLNFDKILEDCKKLN